MRESDPASSLTTIERLENIWRLKLDETNDRYRAAMEHFKEVLDEVSQGQITGQDGRVEFARQAKTEALAEYMRVLKIFSEITVHGRIPSEPTTGSAEGARQ